MAELQAYLAEKNGKKNKVSFSGSSVAAAESDSDSAGLLSWVPSSVNINMPSVFNRNAEKDEKSDSAWFNEAKSDPCCPAMSRKQRLLGFCACLVGGGICFALAIMYAPFIIVSARKFALLYSLGSLFMISSFSFLWGPWNHVKHLATAERLPFTIAYFGSLFATLFFALSVRSTVLTTIAAVIQIIALLWYLVSYIPGGKTGLSFISRLFTSAVSKTVSRTMSSV